MVNRRGLVKVIFFLRDPDEGPEQGKLWIGTSMENGTERNPNCGHNTRKTTQQYDGSGLLSPEKNVKFL